MKTKKGHKEVIKNTSKHKSVKNGINTKAIKTYYNAKRTTKKCDKKKERAKNRGQKGK